MLGPLTEASVSGPLVSYSSQRIVRGCLHHHRNLVLVSCARFAALVRVVVENVLKSAWLAEASRSTGKLSALRGSCDGSSVDLLASLHKARSSWKSSKVLLGIHPRIASSYACCMPFLRLRSENHLCSKACSTLSRAFSSKTRIFRTKSLARLVTFCHSGLSTIFAKSHLAAAH